MEDILMEELKVAGATFEDALTSTHLQDLRPGRDTNNGIDVCLVACQSNVIKTEDVIPTGSRASENLRRTSPLTQDIPTETSPGFAEGVLGWLFARHDRDSEGGLAPSTLTQQHMMSRYFAPTIRQNSVLLFQSMIDHSYLST